MPEKCCFEKVSEWWAQSSGYRLWIPLLPVANNRSCCSDYIYNDIRIIQGTPHWQHQQPYLTLMPGKSLSKICEIEEGISQCEQGYGAWGLCRELSVSDPGRYTKLPLEQRVLHIPLVIYYKDNYGNLQHYSLYFISDDNTHNTSFVHKIHTLMMEFLKQRLPNVTKIY